VRRRSAMAGEEIIGKTIESVEYGDDDSDETLTLTFTDGTTFSVTSWDHEGFTSGLYVGGRPTNA